MTDEPRKGDVEDVIITAELERRPSRSPQYEAENRALVALAEAMAKTPQAVLQRVAEAAADLTRSGSAGISLLEGDEPDQMLRWVAASGASAANLNGAVPRDESPCGIVLSRDEIMLFRHPERSFPLFRDVEPKIAEALLAPFQIDGHAAGTLWAIKHDPEALFEAEDARVLGSLSRFAASAYQLGNAVAQAVAGAESLRRIVQTARDYAIFTTDPEGRIDQWYEGAEAVFGWTADEVRGEPVDITFTPEDRAQGRPWQEREEARRNDLTPNVRWHIRKDGRRVFIEGIAAAMHGPEGQLTGFLKIGQDVTERRQNEEHQRMLQAELQHRVRNTLGIVRSIVRRTAERSEDVQEMSMHLDGRIGAFSRVQTMVTRNPEGGVDLAALVEDELRAQAAREGELLKIEGPEVRLKARPAESISLAIHELATNAVKYGALSTSAGRIDIRWTRVTRADSNGLELVWEENGMDLPPGAPERTGFGMELLTRSLPYDLVATTEVEFRPEGLRFSLAMPLGPEVLAD